MIHVVMIGPRPIAAMSTRARANALVARLRALNLGEDFRIFDLTTDSIVSLVQGGARPFMLTWTDIDDAGNVEIEPLAIGSGTIEDLSFSFDSATRQLDLLVWAADQSAAATKGEVERARLGAFL